VIDGLDFFPQALSIIRQSEELRLDVWQRRVKTQRETRESSGELELCRVELRSVFSSSLFVLFL
jgi:hypothetical protein